MQEMIREYGAVVVAAVGSCLLFGIIGKILLAPDGLLARMILLWGNGGC